MAQKKMVMGVAAFLLVAVLFVGWLALAADMGGKEDPLVTLSYLDSLNPQIQELIAKTVQDEAAAYIDEQRDILSKATEALEKRIAEAGSSADIAALISDPEFIRSVAAEVASQVGTSGNIGGAAVNMSTFKKVEVKNGQTLYLSLGSLVVLRVGNAVCVASGAPGLIDLTDGKELNKDGALLQNHLYTMTISDVTLDGTGAYRGFKATSQVTVFVIGDYSIK